MTNKELVINMLAELSTKEISEVVNPEFFSEHEDTARRGGNIDKIKDNLRILYACKLKSFM